VASLEEGTGPGAMGTGAFFAKKEWALFSKMRNSPDGLQGYALRLMKGEAVDGGGELPSSENNYWATHNSIQNASKG